MCKGDFWFGDRVWVDIWRDVSGIVVSEWIESLREGSR